MCVGGGGEKGGCPGPLGCLAASLGSIHYIRVALLILTAKNVSRYYQVSPGRLEVNLRHVELEESMEQPIKVAPSSSWDNFPKATKIYIIANLSQENGKYLSKGVSLLQKKLELPQESQCVKGRLRMRYSHWRLRK